MSETSTIRRRRRVIPALAAIAISTALTVDTAPAVVHAGPSGTDAPAGNLAGWRQIFVDNFTTNVARGSFPDAVSGKWGAYPSPWRDTSNKGVYSPKDVVYIANGVLTKDIHTAGGVHKVAALTPKVPGSSSYGQLYGRYEVRMRTDPLPGYKVAWMLWPDSGTVTTGAVGGGGNGEIDYPEGDLYPTDKIWGFVHRQNATSGSDQAWFRIPVNLTGWHTYTIEWSPGLVRFLLDGAEVGRTTERIPNTPMHWVLQTETSIKVATADSTRGNVQIDWVAAWAYDTSLSAPVATDTAGPAVAVAGVAPGATVRGVVNVAANASDPAGVTAVKWYVDGVEVKHDGDGAPWAGAWDTRSVGNGEHRIFAKARDGKGNWSTSTSQAIVVAN
jgi:Glycosyl hydrolases family 16/Bacterial Ig domain